MPALSFQKEWIDKLLSGAKQQTTRPQTDRIKVGDIVSMYNQQRRRIADKPLRMLTVSGIEAMHDRGYPFVPEFLNAHYHAHLLGKVEIPDVYDIYFPALSHNEFGKWAQADGFKSTRDAELWFIDRYGCDYPADDYTVIRWNGWLERYFEPEE